MEEYIPHIGKNVIETLTLGMYENAHFIYREYVQNAADQIDVAVEEGILNKKSEGRINILIDKVNKTIRIEDNATGIRSREVLQFLGDVANSQKDRTKRKGFRGIGRLGGLGYCETLVFETSYQGENIKNKISLNAKQLKLIIDDVTISMDAAEVISVITSLEKDNENIEEHYFKVKLLGVTNNDLLNEIGVKNYLSMVAPVPFKEEFTFSKKIHKYFKLNNVKIEEYNVHLRLNNEKLYKAYKNNVRSKSGYKPVEIIDIDLIKILDKENELIALGWYGVTDLLNQIIHQDDIERGFRIRKDNIQIGSKDTLNGFFKEDRFNHHFVGEIHVVGDSFIPNARRDFFNDNATIKLFKTKLEKQFNNLYDLSHISSDFHSGINKIIEFKKQFEIYESRSFSSKYEEEQAVSELDELKKEAFKGQAKIEKTFIKADNKNLIQAAVTIYEYKTNNKNLIIDNEVSFDIREYEKPKLSKLKDSEKQLIYNIFQIIENSINDSAIVIKLKKKIAERYN